MKISEKIEQDFKNSMSSARSYHAYSIWSARRIRRFARRHADLLGVSEHWFFSGDYLFMPVGSEGKRTKSEFALAVKSAAFLLDLPPSINLEPSSYSATWEVDGFHVRIYMDRATDCKTIEVEETVKKLRPHPECAAALKTLEDL